MLLVLVPLGQRLSPQHDGQRLRACPPHLLVDWTYCGDAGLDGIDQHGARLDGPDVLVGLGVALIERLTQRQVDRP